MMRDSTSDGEFMAGLRGAVRSNALSNMAMRIFSPRLALDRSKLTWNVPARATVARKKTTQLAEAKTTRLAEAETTRLAEAETTRLAEAETTRLEEAPTAPVEVASMEIDSARTPLLLDQSAGETGTLRVKKKSRTRK